MRQRTNKKNSGRVRNESNTVRELVSQKLPRTFRIDFHAIACLNQSHQFLTFMLKYRSQPFFSSCLLEFQN